MGRVDEASLREAEYTERKQKDPVDEADGVHGWLLEERQREAWPE